MNNRMLVAAISGCLVFQTSPPAMAGDEATARPSSRQGLIGFYAGGHLGEVWGTSDWTITDSVSGSDSGSSSLYQSYDAFAGTGSYASGLQAGYLKALSPNLVVGFEADISFPNTVQGTAVSATGAQFLENINFFGTVRGKVGYNFSGWTVYATAGLAWVYEQITRTSLSPGAPDIAKTDLRSGWTAGAGLEVPIGANWTADLLYLYSDYGGRAVTFDAANQAFSSELTTQSLRLGLNYHFGDQPEGSQERANTGSDRWAVHGQTTVVYQYAAPFRAPYHGTNSLIPNQGAETWDVTFYLGARLWEGGEIWVNPEVDQGFGVSRAVGAAAFPSAEAYKVGADEPYTRLPRFFVRQTLNLDGDTEAVEAGINQFAATVSKNRLVATVGKFSVPDIFDANKYAHDPRSDFLNWALVDTAAFDYAADAWAFTYGAAIEWYQGPWTLRGGVFDLPIVPNSTDLDPTFAQHQWVAEVERRFDLFGQPGKLAATGYLTRGRMGSFDDALALAAPTGAAPDLGTVRRYHDRLGLGVNLEQQISSSIGAFMRGGLADGRYEPFAFTDSDWTAATGIVLSGDLWGRPKDTIGIAGLINGISASHEAYLNAGGLTALVGDGKLPHPAPEEVFEAYYSFPLLALRVTGDYQLINNPGFNQDRGPVSLLAVRVRSQF